MKMTMNDMLMTLTTFHDGKMMEKMMKDEDKAGENDENECDSNDSS